MKTNPLRHVVSSAVLVTIVATSLLTFMSPADAGSATRDVVLKPRTLERGADVGTPRIVDGRIVDGSTRLDVPGSNPDLIGRTATGYLVETSRGGAREVLELAPDTEPRTVVADVADLATAVAPGDAARVIVVRYRLRTDTAIARAYDTASAEVVGRHRFDGNPSVLDVDGEIVLMSSWNDETTFAWEPASGTISSYVERTAGAGSLANDVVSSYTRDPYLGGCTVVSDLHAQTRYWRSCSERVTSFSPDGRRFATVPILTDGVGPNEVVVRSLRGRLIARYTTRSYFGRIEWESDDALLLDTTSGRTFAVVRCVATRCERATRSMPAGTP
ncbi:MAG: hypothetical protein F2667_08720 [Actinobacteria bacterium]|uniref:Unannotated protein n=1 Tax=freshwater metagenome TaxID=449393 RepID=A0A6J6QUF4_9ZZZZ|nr:hypothetical protein [Actinomycetota bacterium]